MTVFRLLLLLAAAWLVWRLLRGVRIHLSRQGAPPPPVENFERMAQCAQCGVHQPASTLSPDGRCGKCLAG